MVRGISAVIRTRNREKSLEEALHALKHQTQDISEIIVVDDHSTDNTAMVCHKAGARYIPAVGTGLVDTLDEGIAAANYALIFLVDDDNIPDKNCLAELRSKFTRKSGCIKPRTYEDAKQSKANIIIRLIRTKQRKLMLKLLGTKDEFYGDTASLGLCNVGNCSLIQKKAWDAIGIGDKKCGRLHDLDMGIRMKKAGYDLIKLSKPLTHHNQLSKQNQRNFHRDRALNTTHLYKKHFNTKGIINKIRFTELILIDILYMCLKAIFVDKSPLSILTTIKYTVIGLS